MRHRIASIFGLRYGMMLSDPCLIRKPRKEVSSMADGDKTGKKIPKSVIFKHFLSLPEE